MPETVTSPGPTRRLTLLQPGSFRMPERLDVPIHLLGARCRSCGEAYFPKRVYCANCSSDQLEEFELPDHGIVSTFTIVRQQLPGSAMTPPYAIVRVAMAGGLTVQTVMVDCDPERVRIGDRVEMIAHLLREEGGELLVSYLARPVAGA